MQYIHTFAIYTIYTIYITYVQCTYSAWLLEIRINKLKENLSSFQMREMEISRILAEQTLREHRGDVVEALVTLTNWYCTGYRILSILTYKTLNSIVNYTTLEDFY